MSGPLDGPRMTYGGPDGQPARQGKSAPWTPILLVACLLLAVAIVVLAGRAGQTDLAAGRANASPTSTATPSPANATPQRPSPSVRPEPAGGDAATVARAPVGADEAANQFVKAWVDGNRRTRVPALEKVATPALVDQIGNTDPAKLPAARPRGRAAPVDVSAYAAEYQQRLSDGSAIRIGLVADPDAGYGWLVDSVTPKA